MAHHIFNSPIGPVLIKGTTEGLTSVQFVDDSPPVQPATKKIPEILLEASSQLTEYFCGLRQNFTLDLAPSGTIFQQNARQAISNIPYGETRSYKQLAETLLLPGGSRAVGMANANNPFLLLVPCHRVIGASGILTGYAGGILRKRWLLQHEAQSVQLPIFAGARNA